MYVEERSPVVLENCGQKLFGIFHEPKREEGARVPTVLICHGFGGNKIGSQRLYVLLAESLASLGIAVLRIDFRGSGDSEGDFKETTIQNQLSDVACSLNFLENHQGVDQSKIGILGGSLGGALAVLAASKYKKIKSLALWAPVAGSFQWDKDWEVISSAESPYIEHNGKLVIKAFYEEFFSMDIESALKSVPHYHLLHIHGELDTTVSTEHQNRYKSWREDASGKSKFVTLPGSDHSFSNKEEQEFMIKESAEWFLETLI